MVSQHQGGEKTSGGIYWSAKAWEFVAVPSEGGLLAGRSEDAFTKVPAPVVLVAAPITGLALAILLPVSGILGAMSILSTRFGGSFGPGIAYFATPRLSLGMSHLQPRAGARETAPAGSAPEDEEESRLAALALEISQRRESLSV